MSKKKKKKTNNRERQHYHTKEGWTLFSLFIIVGIFSFAYENIFESFSLTLYKPYYFVSSQSDLLDALLTVFGIFVVFSLGIYLIGNTKISKNKYILRSFVIALTMLIGIFIFNCNVWVFNKDAFSYNTLFQKEKIIYSYNEIESADVNIYSNRRGKFGEQYHIDYTLYMDNGEKVKFDAYNAYYTDDDKIIEFDKMIANKRSVIDEDYDHELYDNDKLNEYYSSLYNNQK